MSALVSSQGAVFVTETSGRSASVAGAFLSETASTVSYDDFAGDLSTPVALAADLTLIQAPKASLYGKGSYGVNHYSRVSTHDLAGDLLLVGSVSADLDITGQDFFDGTLPATVNFAGALTLTTNLSSGDLPVSVVFAGSLTGQTGLAGNLPVQIDLGGAFTGEVPFDGDLPLQIVLACSTVISGPLWASSEPCPTPPWAPSEPCPPSMWTPTGPCDPVEWEKTELCDG